MPKIKTHSGMKKRIKLTKRGKLKRGRAYGNHMLEKKSQTRKQGYRKQTKVDRADKKNVKRMLGK
ncbi:MAG: 50S ribosomal protein L35 [Candidatus Saccharimonadales bacterium]